MSLPQEDIDRIADAMVVRIQKTHHNFWIEPEDHYKEHLDMREVIGSWKSAKGIFARAFIGLVVTGTIAVMVAGALTGLGKPGG